MKSSDNIEKNSKYHILNKTEFCAKSCYISYYMEKFHFMKNLEKALLLRTKCWIQIRSGGQSSNSDFIRHSVYRVIQTKVDHISFLLEILFINNFEVTLAFRMWNPCYVKPNYFFTHIQKCNFRTGMLPNIEFKMESQLSQ